MLLNYLSHSRGSLQSLTYNDVPNASFTLTNVLSWNNKGSQYSINTNIYPSTSWLVQYSSTGGGGTSPSTSGQFQHMFNSAPTGMGTGPNQCIAYIPGGHNGCNSTPNPGIASNMVNKGIGGNTDIGANLVYQYYNGSLNCAAKYWDQSTSVFAGCSRSSAIVPGVNDNATFPNSACVNVNKRLNVGVHGCPIP
jgi:hypothetical protein